MTNHTPNFLSGVSAGVIFSVSLLFAVSFSLSAQEEYNYTKVYRARTPLEGDISSEGDVTRVNEVTRFYDGLGRPTEAVNFNASPGRKDIISFGEYDDLGRLHKTYMPFAHSTQQTGDYLDLSSAKTAQEQFYSSKTTIQDGANAFTQMQYEKSSLSRVLKALSPGQSWVGSDRGITSQYKFNEVSDNVIAWKVTEDGFEAMTQGYYEAGTLYKQVTISEEDKQVRTYINKRGQTILKEIESGEESNPWYRTYYIYDDRGRQQYVLPPMASYLLASADEGEDPSGGYWMYFGEDTRISNATIADKPFPLTIWLKDGVKVDLVDPFTVNAMNQGDLRIRYGLPPSDPQLVKEMTYQYQYDDRDRLIAQKEPDADWAYMVYDQWDRPVLVQDPNLQAGNQWVFTSYDKLNRPVMTGILTDDRPRGELRTYVESLTDHHLSFSTDGSHGYNDEGFPFNTDIPVSEIHTVNYYDTYEFLELGGWEDFDFSEGIPSEEEDFSVTEDNILTTAKGLITGSKQVILGTDTYLNTSMFYDRKYRPVQVAFHDPQLNVNRTTSIFSFTGSLTATKTAYSGLFAKPIYRWLEYDHMDRLLSVDMQIGENTDNRITLAENNYNEIGELIEKNHHKRKSPLEGGEGGVLQSLDFDYNIRGWLTHLNKADLSSDGSEEYESTDVFGMQLMYDDAPGDAAQYNGNIGRINWKQAYSPVTSNYQYSYDPISRLKSADYGEAGTFALSKFDVTNITHDANGNIKTLNRKADSGSDLDVLGYDYYAGTNRLKSVSDTDGDKSNGFIDNADLDEEYTYDPNGNMKTDANKGITSIEYNHLNLPEVVEQGGIRIEYDYLANGAKIAKRVIKGEETTERLYQNGMVFENGVLDHILTGAGKVMPFIPGNDELLDYQYFITDHLGNVRSVIREERIYEYLASMETEYSETEESQFSKIEDTRQTDPLESYTGESFAIVDNDQPLGPAFALNVTKGDVVDLSVFGKTKQGKGKETVAEPEDVVAALVDAFTTQSITIGESANTLTTGLAEGLAALGMGGSDNTDPTGYLNFMLFDKQFKLITVGFKLFNSGDYTEKTIEDITIEEPGYLITYLSYESSAPDRVFFDDFSITLETSTVIQQEDYSPFGLSFASYAAGDENVYKYNGVEQDPSTGNYEMRFRGYDPSLGRFMQTDPLTHVIPGVSSYHFGFNNPVKFSDALGLMGNNEIYNSALEDPFGRKKYDTWGNYIPPQDREGGATCSGCFSPDNIKNVAYTDNEGNAIYDSDIAATYWGGVETVNSSDYGTSVRFRSGSVLSYGYGQGVLYNNKPVEVDNYSTPISGSWPNPDYIANGFGVSGNVTVIGGLWFDIGVIWNDGDWAFYGALGSSLGLDASIGIEGKQIVGNNRNERFDIGSYQGWGASDNVGIFFMDLGYGGDLNLDDPWAAFDHGYTYQEYSGGGSFSATPVAYTRQTGYTWVFGGNLD